MFSLRLGHKYFIRNYLHTSLKAFVTKVHSTYRKLFTSLSTREALNWSRWITGMNKVIPKLQPSKPGTLFFNVNKGISDLN